jgi:hypothetical protein
MFVASSISEPSTFLFAIFPSAPPDGVRPFAVRLVPEPTVCLKEPLVMPRIQPARPLLIALFALGLPESARAQPATKPAEPPQPKVLIVSPAAAPVPVLKYRLLPSSAELNPGDAAPIYLRIHGYEDTALEESWRQISEKAARWLDLPLAEFPKDEARGFVNLWSGKLQQLEFGTRRKTCDWNYTIPEQRENIIGVLLPDVQSLRQWGRVLVLKARVEIADGKVDEAIRTIETGLAFARHAGGGPFLLNGLIGMAIAMPMLDRCEELIARPGAPNLYWALTALPRPLVGLRDQMELERKLFENLIPELRESELARPRNPAEWAVLLARLHEGIVKWSRFDARLGEQQPRLRELSERELSQFRSAELASAREHLKASRRLTDEQLGAMCEDQIVALHIADGYREIWDDWFKVSYLPARDAVAQQAAALKRLDDARKGPFVLFAAYVAGIYSSMRAELQIDRRFAALRVIEAIRLRAAAHDGALPESLGEITEVPVPDDPATGKPFDYHRDGNSATLSGPEAGLPPPVRPAYRITIRPRP